MAYPDLRELLQALKQEGRLKGIPVPVNPILAIVEITDHVTRAGRPVGALKCGSIDREVPVTAKIILEGDVGELSPEDTVGP
ncbi:MAG: hypothetical protein ACE5IQ_10890 [Candidatus Methylomirabilales bacterium]